MPMSHNGLTKLIEEASEAIQIAAKLQAYPDGNHPGKLPDGYTNLWQWLEDELGDLRAAIQLTIEANRLDGVRISERYAKKLITFRGWHTDPDS